MVDSYTQTSKQCVGCHNEKHDNQGDPVDLEVASETDPLLPNNSSQQSSVQDASVQTTVKDFFLYIELKIKNFFSKSECDCHDKHETFSWKTYRRWNKLADRLNRRYETFQWIVPSLTVIGTVLLTLSTVASWNKWALSISASIALGFVPILRQSFLSDDNLEKLKTCKVMAEEIKSEVFKYLTRVDKYNDDSKTDNELAILLRFKISEIRQNNLNEGTIYNSQLEWFCQSLDMDHDEMLSSYCRDVPTNCRTNEEKMKKIKDWYIEERVEWKMKDIKKYGKGLERRETFLKYLEFILSIVASIIALLQGTNQAGIVLDDDDDHNIFIVLGVFATISGTSLSSYYASTAWSDIHKHADIVHNALEYQILRYYRGIEDWDKFVNDCEEILKSDAKDWFSIKENAHATGKQFLLEHEDKSIDQKPQNDKTTIELPESETTEVANKSKDQNAASQPQPPPPQQHGDTVIEPPQSETKR